MAFARLSIVAVVLLSAVSGGSSLAPAPALAQPTDDGARLLDLAERLLVGRYSGPSGIGGTEENVRLLPGRLASELTLDLPVPPGGRLLGSLVSPSTFNGTSVEVRIDAPGTPNDIQAFYNGAMREQGWNPPSPGTPGAFGPGTFPMGGFQPGDQGLRLERRSSTFCPAPNGGFLRITVDPRLDGPSEVQASFRAPPAEPAGLVISACTVFSPPPPPGPGTIARGPDLVPRLDLPEGTVLAQRGGLSAPGPDLGAYGSVATVTTELSVPTLETYFAAQLQSYQWVRLSSGGDDMLAWSLWHLPEQDEWQGTLIVMRDPADDRRRSLAIRVDSDRFVRPRPGPDGFAPARPPVSPELTANPSLIRELAERLLAESPGAAASSAPTPTLMVGDLAPDLPQDLPMPEGTRVLGSLIRPWNNGRSSSEAILDVPASAQDAQRFFVDEMSRLGWRTPPSAPLGGPSGFVSAFASLTASFCEQESLLYLTFRIRPQSDRSNDVWIMTGGSGALEGGCWPQAEPSGRLSFQSPSAAIPPLIPPPGAQLQAGPMSSGANSFQSGGAIVTAHSPPEIEAFFADQLRAAGWTRLSGAASTPLAWSLWAVPGEGMWEAILLVFEVPGENRHGLSLGVHQVASDNL